MKRVMSRILAVFCAIMLFAAIAGVVFLVQKYTPSKEIVIETEWFGVDGEEVAILLNDELIEAKAVFQENQVYLPIEWVNEALNEKFYWDPDEKLLIYTLPESIVYADLLTTGSSGAPLLIEEGDSVYLLTGLVATYTNIRITPYLEGKAKRIFVDSRWDPEQAAALKKEGKIREKGGIKSAIMTTLPKDSQIVILEEMEKWSMVRTSDGFTGYVQNKLLKDHLEIQHISTFEEPEYTSLSMDKPISMVWHQVTTAEANGAMERLMKDVKGVNVIAPTWFMLTDNEGAYHSFADQSYVKKAHDMGVQVWAVLDNFNRGDNVQSEILFSSTTARKNLISSLMADVKKYKIDGINLDIESIKPEAGPHYVQFIRELSVDCRKNGIFLSVDSYVPTSYTSFYNRAEQGRVADYVVIMGYDEHYAGSEMGSVASIGYERKGIEDTMKMVPPEKIISGIPFYTRLWKEAEDGTVTSKAMGISAAKKWIEENKVDLYWQEELGQYYGEHEDSDGHYYIWMEEEESLKRKLNLVRDYKLAGVAYWKLGFEPSELWDVLQLK